MRDTTRVMLRLKAIFRGRAIKCAGHDVYRSDQRPQWLGKLSEPGVKQRARLLYEQLEALKPLRQEAKRAMIKEAQRHPALALLSSVPWLGRVRAAHILAVVETPRRVAH